MEAMTSWGLLLLCFVDFNVDHSDRFFNRRYQFFHFSLFNCYPSLHTHLPYIPTSLLIFIFTLGVILRILTHPLVHFSPHPQSRCNLCHSRHPFAPSGGELNQRQRWHSKRQVQNNEVLFQLRISQLSKSVQKADWSKPLFKLKVWYRLTIPIRNLAIRKLAIARVLQNA